MSAAGLPPNEGRRLEALRSYGVLDTDFESEYDELCRLAAAICETPIALISFVDHDRQWFKAVVGLGVREIDRDAAFCAHAIWQDKIFEVPDATRDPRFADNPLVLGDPDIRFYAGQPLVNADGLALGTLCTIDRVPRTLTPNQRTALDILARQVVVNLELRRTMADLKRLNEDKDRFFSIIAHDLRSPFAGLLGLVDLMQASGGTLSAAESRKFTGLIHGSLHRVYNLMENLLHWAELEQGHMPYTPDELDVASLFDEVLLPLQEALAAKHLAVEKQVAEGFQVTGDRNMLTTAVRNQLTNAMKFTRPGGRIVLAATATTESVRLSVKDTGIGMAAELLEQLQDGVKAPSQPGTEGESGTGLGLRLVRQFAAQHGGTLEIESQEGVGTTTTLVLPA